MNKKYSKEWPKEFQYSHQMFSSNLVHRLAQSHLHYIFREFIIVVLYLPEKSSIYDPSACCSLVFEHCALYIHVFTLTNCISSSFSFFLCFLFTLLPAFIVMIICEQLMPTNWTRVVLILLNEP